MRIAIIGGGASGLTAAIAASENNAEVTIYERGERIGKKILATGNGRCNMTNVNAVKSNYYGNDINFIDDTIEKFWVKETLQMFSNMGIIYKTEDEGKVYPYSDQASSVLDVLRMKISETGVLIRSGFDVSKIQRENRGFYIYSYKNEREYADKVIVACGGKAAPSTGSDGNGYEILKKLGHHITDTKPSLVQIKTDTDIVKKLKGIKVNGKLTIGKRSKIGEILFTDYGLSGPPVFSLSANIESNKYVILDIMPEYDEETIIRLIADRISSYPKRHLEDFFVGMLNKRVGQVLMKYLGIEPLSRYAITLTEADTKKIAHTIKAWEFNMHGTMSWNNAQVTKGGADTAEFNSATMESKKIKGLYACGEILDIDGDCGGYNLQWAWSSGYIAGYNASFANK